MNLLADECVPAEVVARLRADGHAIVEAAGDAEPGPPMTTSWPGRPGRAGCW